MMQEELAKVTSRQQQLSVSDSAAQQQLAALAEAYEKASTACAAAEGEERRLGLLLQDSEAQVLQAQQKESQVRLVLMHHPSVFMAKYFCQVSSLDLILLGLLS